MRIGGVQKVSLLDFPDKLSTIVFTQGCNFRCGYCHNPELTCFESERAWTESQFFGFLRTRISKIDGVVISGGEPCLQTDLVDFIKQIKQMGFLVKLDTNGSFPWRLKELLPYLDYIAMDIKAPLASYPLITNTKVSAEDISESVHLIMESNIDYEFRTTVVRSQLSFDDFRDISYFIDGAKKYYLQKFVSSKHIDESMCEAQTYTDVEFMEIIELLKLRIKDVFLRG